ncbi:MAG: class I SAM-dependent methyltransferase [Legionellaceae bacterium]|nr:class I SAM-dependent methyltransferase [Legionellaceae bacterium]
MARNPQQSLSYEVLHIPDKGLALCLEGCAPIVVDFEETITKRCQKGLKKPAILKACKPAPELKILDATAGFGRDAALLASSGANVTMCEREPLLIDLLQDGLKRLPVSSALDLRLVPMDVMDYLPTLEPDDYPDIIYLDPMHPTRTKSAKVKKDLHALQTLLGESDNVVNLLTFCRAYATLRVVLKWPAKRQALLTPNYVVEGKTVRFDVYLANKPVE